MFRWRITGLVGVNLRNEFPLRVEVCPKREFLIKKSMICEFRIVMAKRIKDADFPHFKNKRI